MYGYQVKPNPEAPGRKVPKGIDAYFLLRGDNPTSRPFGKPKWHHVKDDVVNGGDGGAGGDDLGGLLGDASRVYDNVANTEGEGGFYGGDCDQIEEIDPSTSYQ